MNKDIKIRKELLSPPGDTIQETIDTIGMNQYELANRMGKPVKNINRIIKGKEAISPKTAISLSRVLGIDANFWLEREREYRQELAEIEADQILEKSISKITNFPIKDLITLKWIKKESNKLDLLKSLLSFFSIASLDQWDNIYLNEAVSASFRLSLSHSSNPEAISSWLRIGELETKKLGLKEYNKSAFQESLSEIKNLSYKHPQNFKEKLKEICTESGVALVFTPNLSKAPISGAARWIFNNEVPIIQLSGRHKTNDHFWFTFFHEAGHILLHGKKDVFLEKVDGKSDHSTKETEANEFAQKWFLKDEDLIELSKIILSDLKVIKYSKSIKTHPGIIVGILQHKEIISYSQMNELKIKINLFE